jgi:hypothetical protein
LTSSAVANPEGFPWGSNNPSRRQRLIVALFIALVAGFALYFHFVRFGERSDFSQALFGARALAHGADPYKLVGPGRVYESAWPVMYPATTYLVAMPFAPLTDRLAASLFVAISTFLLAYGSTAGSWHRLPIFASIAFTASVQFAQWSLLTTAMLFLPWLAFFAAAKPQAAIPILASSPSRKALGAAALGAVLLAAVSLAFFPAWPLEWWRVVREGEQLRAPILRFGGVFIALVLLRWRRAEAWLVLLSACMPQSWAWYNVLVLLTVAYTYREACVLSLTSSVGALATVYFVGGGYSAASYPAWGASMVAFAYLPATIAILRRPNVRAAQPWQPRAVPHGGELA